MISNSTTVFSPVPAQMTRYTGPTTQDLAHIPAVLTTLPQWVLWRGEDRVDAKTGEIKLNKIPINPHTLHNADTTDITTWGSCAQAVAALPVALEEWEQDDPSAYRGGGIGFVFTADDPVAGIDLDHAVDPVTGRIEPWAQPHMQALDSYTEVSPSGTGLHILVEGTLPPTGRKKGPVEMYTSGRFFTMTGWHLPGTPHIIASRHEALEEVHGRVFGPQALPRDGGAVACYCPTCDYVATLSARGACPGCSIPPLAAPVALTPTLHAPSPVLEDAVLLAKAQSAKNQAKFAALWAGDRTGYGSPSEADLALCNLLAFWTQDADQIDRLFRQSGLMRPKWDEQHGAQTYGALTMQTALALPQAQYAPQGQGGPIWGTPGQTWGTPGPEPPDPSVCPNLPAYAATNTALAEGASLFLDDYITISAQWAPRAYEGFHEAVALFLLSTIAARRIKLRFGPRGVYTSLYLALAARTTVYAKSTTADIGMALLDAAGLSWLLADDDSTPQAFLRSLSLYVPTNYADMTPDEQAHIRHQLAFTGQRGWFYEEFGQHLEAMMQKNSYMAGFRGILRRLDDHKERYTSNTIARGRETLHTPYVSLLANVTPSDLQPFAKARASLWRDGYMARFAFVTPDHQTPGSDAEFPEGSLSFPPYLVTTLQRWHKRLGIPTCALTPQADKKGQATGKYTVEVSPLPEKVYTLHPEVRTAYYTYDRALRELTRQRQDEDLDGSYGRFPMKALRIAGLLASLHDDSGKYTVWPWQWHRGQQIVERWRRDLHRLLGQVQHSESPQHPKRLLEEKLLRQIGRSGPQSLRDLALFQKAHSREEIEDCLTVLVATGELARYATAQTTKYGYPTAGGHPV